MQGGRQLGNRLYVFRATERLSYNGNIDLLWLTFLSENSDHVKWRSRFRFLVVIRERAQMAGARYAASCMSGP